MFKMLVEMGMGAKTHVGFGHFSERRPIQLREIAVS